MEQLVSIIIPAYNYGHYLKECLKSLQHQNHTSWEAIIVDDGSTDDTAKIATEFTRLDERFQYVWQENSGQPSARNNGMRLAKGTFIQFLDADDILQENKLLSQVVHLQSNPGIDVVYSEVFYFTTEQGPNLLIRNRWDEPEKPWIPNLTGSGQKIVNAYARKNIFELGCALFRSEALVNNVTFNRQFRGVEDYDFCWRIAIQGLSFAYMSSSENGAVLMRHHTNSFSKNITKMYIAELNMRKHIAPLLSNNGFYEAAKTNRKIARSRYLQLQDLLVMHYRKGMTKPGALDIPFHIRHGGIGRTAFLLSRLLKNFPAFFKFSTSRNK